MANPFQGAGTATTAAVDALKGVGSALASIASAGSAVINLIPGLSQLQSVVLSLGSSISSGLVGTLRSAIQPLQAFASGILNSVKSFIALNPVAYAFVTVLDRVGTAFKAVSSATIQVANAAYQYVKATNQMVAGIAGYGAEVARAGAALLRLPLDALDSAISAIQINVARFVKLASPGVYQRFQLAVDDLYASIGRALIPVLESATYLFRSIGGALFGLDSNGQKAIQALAGGTAGMLAFAAAAVVVQTVLSGGLMPIISAVVGGMAGLIATTDAFKPVMDQLGQVVGGVLNSFGRALSTLMPVAQPFLNFIGAFGTLIAASVVEWSNLFTDLAPHIGAFVGILSELNDSFMAIITDIGRVSMGLWVDSFKTIIPLLAQAAPYVSALVRVIGDLVSGLIRWTASLLGLSMPELSAPKGEVKNNVGAAPRSTSTGSVDDVLRKARESAFALGSGANKPEDQTAKNTDEINKAIREQQAKIQKIVDSVAGTWDEIKLLPDKVAGYIQAGATVVANAVQKVGGGAATGVAGVAGLAFPAAGIGSVVGRTIENLYRNK